VVTSYHTKKMRDRRPGGGWRGGERRKLTEKQRLGETKGETREGEGGGSERRGEKGREGGGEKHARGGGMLLWPVLRLFP
jgi:hypothetical protein